MAQLLVLLTDACGTFVLFSPFQITYSKYWVLG